MKSSEINALSAAYLKKIHIFQDLEEEQLESAVKIAQPREFAASETIMNEGEPGDSLFIIGKGEVQVAKALTMKFGEDDFRETEKTLSLLKADDHVVFGEMALVTEAERSATITALTDCTLYEINRKDFMELALQQPELAFKVALRISELLSRRLKKSGEDVIRLTTALSIALTPSVE